MSKEEKESQKFSLLSWIISHVANESVLLQKYEAENLNIEFLQLWSDYRGNDFNKEINKSLEHLGAPPKFFLVADGKTAPPSDNYPESAMSEIFSVYNRARKSVIRTHMYNAGSSVLLSNDFLLSDMSPTQQGMDHIKESIEEAFWEHAESSYIRLCSYWDRIGQILDFAFFNIRKFDHNGFNGVMDRIHANIVPMNIRMTNCESWKRLRKFQASEKDDGLKFLLIRRNLIIHSLHLHPVKDGEKVFQSQVNHLDEAHRKKLKPRTPEEEVVLLKGQLDRASQLFIDVVKILKYSASRKVDPVIHKI